MANENFLKYLEGISNGTVQQSQPKQPPKQYAPKPTQQKQYAPRPTQTTHRTTQRPQQRQYTPQQQYVPQQRQHTPQQTSQRPQQRQYTSQQQYTPQQQRAKHAQPYQQPVKRQISQTPIPKHANPVQNTSPAKPQRAVGGSSTPLRHTVSQKQKPILEPTTVRSEGNRVNMSSEQPRKVKRLEDLFAELEQNSLEGDSFKLDPELSSMSTDEFMEVTQNQNTNAIPQDFEIPMEQQEEEEEEYQEPEPEPVDIGQLVKDSETFFQDEWIAMYEKALRSKKQNSVAEKMRRGRFRINEKHQIEILADMNTSNLSADDMLNMNWSK